MLEAMDLAEDRGKFARLLREMEIPAPPHGEARTPEEARAPAAQIGYPVVVRPSYVLGGRAMEIVYDGDELDRFVHTAAAASGVPCITTLPGVFAAVRGIEALRDGPTVPRSLQEHHAAARRGLGHPDSWFVEPRAAAREAS